MKYVLTLAFVLSLIASCSDASAAGVTTKCGEGGTGINRKTGDPETRVPKPGEHVRNGYWAACTMPRVYACPLQKVNPWKQKENSPFCQPNITEARVTKVGKTITVVDTEWKGLMRLRCEADGKLVPVDKDTVCRR